MAIVGVAVGQKLRSLQNRMHKHNAKRMKPENLMIRKIKMM